MKSSRECLDELLGTRCACGLYKKTKMSHCSMCYRQLPKELQSALYLRLLEGYEEAYNASLAFLRELGRVK